MYSPTTPSPMPPTPPTPQKRRNNYDHPHSDLEVVPDSADHDKTFIANSPYSHHDKILVPPQPYYQKEVVEVQQNVYPDIHSLASAAYDETAPPPPIPPTPRREKILGFRRKTFFILVWIISIALAIAIGVGAGTNNNTEPATVTITKQPRPTTTRTASIITATSTALSSQSSSTANTGGGRCSNQWGADCVCLDQGICANVWRGTAYTGYEGNWPCPGAAANVMACVVKPCLGKAKGAQCLWREACREVNPAPAGSAAICPGDGEFVCCAHEWV